MHDDGGFNPATTLGEGHVTLGPDGSLAAFVPARRALSWQLEDPVGEAVVRERYWLSFRPGEIRSCASCHGLNTDNQAGGGIPTNTPQALTDLLQHWKTTVGPALGAAATGNVGAMGGEPVDVLTINGSAGGFARRVDVASNAPFTFSVDSPSGAVAPTENFVLWGQIGVPGSGDVFGSPVGDIVFSPYHLFPSQTGLFVFANNFSLDPAAILPSTPAPWSFTLPAGIAPGGSWTLQGVMATPGENPLLAVTNGLILRIESSP